nr:hypothetical protein [Jatrophihabitans sp. GAS493]
MSDVLGRRERVAVLPHPIERCPPEGIDVSEETPHRHLAAMVPGGLTQEFTGHQWTKTARNTKFIGQSHDLVLSLPSDAITNELMRSSDARHRGRRRGRLGLSERGCLIQLACLVPAAYRTAITSPALATLGHSAPWIQTHEPTAADTTRHAHPLAAGSTNWRQPMPVRLIHPASGSMNQADGANRE